MIAFVALVVSSSRGPTREARFVEELEEALKGSESNFK
jgi:hypothetical protein